MQNHRRLLRAKIHRATVTHADLEYEGSVTIPPDLMAAADLVEHEAVHLWSVTSGARLETYAITGASGSRDICVNGAAAHLIRPGHVIIIAAFVLVPEDEARRFEPKLVFVDRENRILPISKEIPGPTRRREPLVAI